MNDLVQTPNNTAVATQAAVPSYLQQAVQQVDNKALSEGLTSSLVRISYRGGTFRTLENKTEHYILEPAVDVNGNPIPGQPARQIHVAILFGNPKLSKTFYASQYQEGTQAQPDCTSSNGITPDSHVQNPINHDCASCPNNAWGSAKTSSGKSTKACSDQKRIAVLLYQPGKSLAESPIYLLSIPPSSLSNFSNYLEQQLNARNLPAPFVRTVIGFDHTTSHPKLTFAFGDFVAEQDVPVIQEALTKTTQLERIVGMAEVPDTRALPAPAQEAVAQIPAHIPPAVDQAPAPQTQAPVQQFQAPAPQAQAPVQQFQAPAPQAQAPAPAEVAQQPLTPQVEVDKHGVPYDPALHSSSKAINADGHWKKKRGAGKAQAAPQQVAAPVPTTPATAPAVAPSNPALSVSDSAGAQATTTANAAPAGDIGSQLDSLLANLPS